VWLSDSSDEDASQINDTLCLSPELEHGCRSTISEPYNFVHRLHVEEDLTWKDLSGNEALSNLQLVEKLGEGYVWPPIYSGAAV
jgi:hypothetical protein